MAAWERWRVEYASASQPDDPFPAWDTDLTPYVDTEKSTINIGGGRPTELDDNEPGHLSLVLNNADHRFDDFFRLARRIRVRETIGPRTFDLFAGYVELPSIDDWAESGDQQISLSAVDRLTRLDRGRTLSSVLTEHIRYSAGSGLVAYWPLTESSGTSFATRPVGQPPLMAEAVYSSDPATNVANNEFTAGAGDPAGDDELRLPLWKPQMALFGGTYTAIADTYLTVRLDPPITVTRDTDALTIVVWVKPTPVFDAQFYALELSGTGGAGNGANIYIRRADSFETPPGVWKSRVWDLTGAGTYDTTAYGTPTPFGTYSLIAVRVRPASFGGVTMTMWNNGDQYTGTVAGLASPTMVFDALRIGKSFSGSIGHIQIYKTPVGSASDWTGARQTAQLQAGWEQLRNQTAGQRVRTLAAYAGVPAGEVVADEGSSVMSMARLAGKSALDAMRDAERTERGVLLADGAGRLVHQARDRRYNL